MSTVPNNIFAFIKKLEQIIPKLFFLSFILRILPLSRDFNHAHKLWNCIIKYPLSFPLLALRIHVSPDTKKVLEEFGTFDLELRGPVEMKVREYFYFLSFFLYFCFLSFLFSFFLFFFLSYFLSFFLSFSLFLSFSFFLYFLKIHELDLSKLSCLNGCFHSTGHRDSSELFKPFK